MNRKLLGWLTAGFALLATACSDDLLPAGTSSSGETDDEVTVTFTVAPEEQTLLTRADVGTDYVHYPTAGEFAQISDGTKATRLHYAVYNENYELLEQYGDAERQTEGSDHYGQKIIEKVEFPHSIELRLIRNQKYHIAFWAQAPNCKAYDTDKLTQVHVLYKDENGNNFKNNDELRDAFCKVESFTVTASDQSRTVVLKRPLAQINVGTAGYNYEFTKLSEEDNSDNTEGLAYLYSRIELTGVATYFDVVRNKVLKKEDLKDDKGNDLYVGINEVDLTQDIAYSYARIPAYVNYGSYGDDGEFEEGALPDDYPAAQIPQKNEGETYTAYYRRFQEQFLRVKFYSKSDSEEPYIPYKSMADNSDNSDPATETFKYLSMCYVLVPDNVNTENGTPYSTTLDQAVIYIATAPVNGDEFQLGDDGAQTYTVQHLPVQRNWRTNIFGKHLIGYNYEPIIDLSPIYNGEYNKDGDSEWKTGTPWVDGNSAGNGAQTED